MRSVGAGEDVIRTTELWSWGRGFEPPHSPQSSHPVRRRGHSFKTANWPLQGPRARRASLNET